MKIFKHEGHIAYEVLRNKIVIMKRINNNKIKFYYKNCGFVNFKFRIAHFGKFIKIRCPIFYFNKNNGGFQIGLPNIYIWFIT